VASHAIERLDQSSPGVRVELGAATGAGEGELLTADRLPTAASRCRAVSGVYVHVPFCVHKCHYCDFYSFVDRDGRQPAFVRRLIDEWAAAARGWEAPLETIFIGGGTPSLLAEPLWRDLLQARREFLPLVADGEFTVEANPETLTPELIEALVDGGVTRVSMGVQSFNPRHLLTLERRHQPQSVIRGMATLRRGGVREINVDLIFGIPGQTLEEWTEDLEEALALKPDHVSAYGLTYEPNTPMTHRLRSGEFVACPEELEAAMLECARDRLAAAGFAHYEISNWARRDQLGERRCRHNLLYWTNRDWWAFGPSASGHVQGVRWKNTPRLGEWLATGPWSPVVDVEQVDARTRSGERIMIGLRLLEGLPEAEFDALLRCGSDAEERAARAASLERRGLLERGHGGERPGDEGPVEGPGVAARSGRRVRLTPRGVLLANVAIEELL